MIRRGITQLCSMFPEMTIGDTLTRMFNDWIIFQDERRFLMRCIMEYGADTRLCELDDRLRELDVKRRTDMDSRQ